MTKTFCDRCGVETPAQINVEALGFKILVFGTATLQYSKEPDGGWVHCVLCKSCISTILAAHE